MRQPRWMAWQEMSQNGGGCASPALLPGCAANRSVAQNPSMTLRIKKQVRRIIITIDAT